MISILTNHTINSWIRHAMYCEYKKRLLWTNCANFDITHLIKIFVCKVKVMVAKRCM